MPIGIGGRVTWCVPRRLTIMVLGPWLSSVPSEFLVCLVPGFALVTRTARLCLVVVLANLWTTVEVNWASAMLVDRKVMARAPFSCSDWVVRPGWQLRLMVVRWTCVMVLVET